MCFFSKLSEICCHCDGQVTLTLLREKDMFESELLSHAAKFPIKIDLIDPFSLMVDLIVLDSKIIFIAQT